MSIVDTAMDAVFDTVRSHTLLTARAVGNPPTEEEAAALRPGETVQAAVDAIDDALARADGAPLDELQRRVEIDDDHVYTALHRSRDTLRATAERFDAQVGAGAESDGSDGD